MEEKNISYHDFLELKAENYELLKEEYLKKVEKADDKGFAKSHLHRTLFKQNKKIPFNTMLWHNVVNNFNIFEKLDKEESIQEILKMLDRIKKNIKMALDSIQYEEQENGLSYALHDTLPLYYSEILSSGKVNLKTLIKEEKAKLRTTKEEVVEWLAIFRAGQDLVEEFPDESEIPDDFGLGVFTYRDIGMAYMLQAMAINPDFTKKITYAYLDKFIYSMMRRDYPSRTADSDFYLKISNFGNKKYTDADRMSLLRLRPFFVKLHLDEVVKIIDEILENFA